MERFKKSKKSTSPNRTGTGGNFMNKPDNGWIHPDEQLAADGGICYGIRYIGCLRIKESMKNLDFDTRTNLAREAIRIVAETGGFKPADKRRKVDKRIQRMLGDMPSMEHAGDNVNLTITTAGLNLMIMESGEVIADHAMPGISFASGGDSETMDFVAYVAKDAVNGRACHVFECGGGLAEDVITTVGQAFELRFKEFLQKQPKAVTIPNRTDNMSFEPAASNAPSAWGEDTDVPDIPAPHVPSYSAPPPPYATPSNAPVPPTSAIDPPLIDFSDPFDTPPIDVGKGDEDPKRDAFNMDEFDEVIKTLHTDTRTSDSRTSDSRTPDTRTSDPRPADPRTERSSSGSAKIRPLASEPWFHGPVSRKQAEGMLTCDGDFLVRESTSSAGQYVLTGRQNNCTRHLLLVDPNGVVRTKDQAFDSVSHLISYHRDNDLPIVSQDSELRLIRPMVKGAT